MSKPETTGRHPYAEAVQVSITEISRLTNELDHMLEVMRSALDSLQDDNDAFSAETVLRICLRKYGR